MAQPVPHHVRSYSVPHHTRHGELTPSSSQASLYAEPHREAAASQNAQDVCVSRLAKNTISKDPNKRSCRRSCSSSWFTWFSGTTKTKGTEQEGTSEQSSSPPASPDRTSTSNDTPSRPPSPERPFTPHQKAQEVAALLRRAASLLESDTSQTAVLLPSGQPPMLTVESTPPSVSPSQSVKIPGGAQPASTQSPDTLHHTNGATPVGLPAALQDAPGQQRLETPYDTPPQILGVSSNAQPLLNRGLSMSTLSALPQVLQPSALSPLSAPVPRTEQVAAARVASGSGSKSCTSSPSAADRRRQDKASMNSADSLHDVGNGQESTPSDSAAVTGDSDQSWLASPTRLYTRVVNLRPGQKQILATAASTAALVADEAVRRGWLKNLFG